MSQTFPQFFSEWISITLIAQYSLFLQVGVPFATNREMAIAYGNKNLKNINEMALTSLINLFVASFALFILLKAYSAFSLLVFLYISLNHLSALLITQARSNFRNSKVILTFILEGILIIVGLIYYFDPLIPLQTFLHILILAAIPSLILCSPSPDVFKLNNFKIKQLLKVEYKLIKFGFQLMVFSVSFLVLISWDVIAMKIIFPDRYENYAITLFFSNSANIFTGLIAIFFLPYLGREFGESEHKISLKMIKIFTQYRLIVVIFFIVSLLHFYPVLYFLSNFILHNYRDFLEIIYFRTIAIMIGFIALPYFHFFNAIRKPKISIYLLVITIALTIILSFLLSIYIELEAAFVISITFANLILLTLCNLSFKKLNLIKID